MRSSLPHPALSLARIQAQQAQLKGPSTEEFLREQEAVISGARRRVPESAWEPAGGTREGDIAAEAEGREQTLTAAAQRREAYRDMYADMSGFARESYGVQVELIKKQAEEYETLTGDSVTAAVWATEQMEQAWISAAQKNENFVEGARAGLVDLSKSMNTWGRTGYRAVSDFATSAERTLSTVFFDAARGELDSFRGYFQAFCNSLLAAFADMVAQMLVRWAVLMAIQAFSGGFSGGSSSASPFQSTVNGIFAHAGGTIGETALPRRTVPALAFAGAPRLHQGFAPDEFPAILQEGEEVRPRGMGRWDRALSREEKQPIHIHVTLDGRKIADVIRRRA